LILIILYHTIYDVNNGNCNEIKFLLPAAPQAFPVFKKWQLNSQNSRLQNAGGCFYGGYRHLSHSIGLFWLLRR